MVVSFALPGAVMGGCARYVPTVIRIESTLRKRSKPSALIISALKIAV